ncbi:MAG: transcription elongation factor subunit Spt4 [Methanobacteriaceae archaeon]
MVQKACTSCKRISQKDLCPVCNKPTSTNWSGYLIIIDPDKSDLAKELNITLPGEYALRVR